MKRYTLLAVLFISMIGIAMPITYAQSCHSNEITHIVQQGDNMYRLALRYKLSMEAIASRNAITNLNRILAGQTLCMPSSATAPTVAISPSVRNLLAGYADTTSTQQSLTDTVPIGQSPRSNEYNWCTDYRYWGDGRCDSNNPGVKAYMYRVGWYLPRILAGEFTQEEVSFLFDEMTEIEGIDKFMLVDIQRKLRLLNR